MNILLALVVPALAFETNLPAMPKLVLTGQAAASVVARRPAAGWVQGELINVTFDRRAWTIKGGAMGESVNLFIDHNAKTIKGGAHGQPLDATFTWSTEKYTLKGDRIDYVIDWRAGTIQGAVNGTPISAQFSLAGGWVKGDGLNLLLDGPSGRLTGGAAGTQVDAVVVNLDLSDLLQHLYLLIK
jgi:hypothetical protein